MALTFFLGANSGDGFFSLYPTLSREEGRRIYAVKGGPGCGKSTSIRRLAEALGGAEEQILCSSDPDSLDGALLPGAAILDGTAPHVVDPAFPGADGDYLPLPAFRDPAGLAKKREALWAYKAASSEEYASAYRLLSALRALREERRALLSPLWDTARWEKKADLLLKKEGLARAGTRQGQVRLRFLDGFTPKGALFLGETAEACACRAVVLRDSAGLGQALLIRLRDGFSAGGETVYSCMDPLEPHRIAHLLIPGRELAILTDDGRRTLPPLPARVLRLEPSPAQPLRGRLRLLRRTEDALLDDITARLASAHAFHDRIEALYRPHLDPEGLEAAYAAMAERVRGGTEVG